MTTLLVKHADIVVTMDDLRREIPDGGLFIRDGFIEQVGPTSELPRTADEVLNLSGHIVLPGLINTHTHAPMSYLRGIADDLPLMTWLHDYIWPAEARWVHEEFVADGSRLAIAEMIRSGTTCFNDMYFFPDVTGRVAAAAGMRAVLGLILLAGIVVNNGILLVDKPEGWTSHDVVNFIRSRYHLSKVGHGGTLDPMATGLVVLGLGRATRLLRYVQAAPKEYVARAVFGVATDSLDADGSILERCELPVSQDEVIGAMGRFVGKTLQVPPMVSARKVDGRRLYDLARQGVEIEREAREIDIYQLELIDFAPSDYPEVTFRVVCSTGTYVRVLADDIARALGGRAHLSALRRG